MSWDKSQSSSGGEASSSLKFPLNSVQSNVRKQAQVNYPKSRSSCENTQNEIVKGLNEEMKGVRYLIMKPIGPLRILIVATMRAGSSFLGGILGSHPGNYFMYEPFSSYCFFCQVTSRQCFGAKCQY